MSKTIGFHTRLYDKNTVKLTGGSFGGTFTPETVEKLVNNFFDVQVKPSGTPVFVDKEGRQVSLYVTVDPASTEKGKAALEKHRKEMLVQSQKEQAEESEIEELLAEMSNEEILRRLRMRS